MLHDPPPVSHNIYSRVGPGELTARLNARGIRVSVSSAGYCLHSVRISDPPLSPSSYDREPPQCFPCGSSGGSKISSEGLDVPALPGSRCPTHPCAPRVQVPHPPLQPCFPPPPQGLGTPPTLAHPGSWYPTHPQGSGAPPTSADLPGFRCPTHPCTPRVQAPHPPLQRVLGAWNRRVLDVQSPAQIHHRRLDSPHGRRHGPCAAESGAADSAQKHQSAESRGCELIYVSEST